MIKKEILDKTSAWPFVEAKKMLRERKSFIDKKNNVPNMIVTIDDPKKDESN